MLQSSKMLFSTVADHLVKLPWLSKLGAKYFFCFRLVNSIGISLNVYECLRCIFAEGR